MKIDQSSLEYFPRESVQIAFTMCQSYIIWLESNLGFLAPWTNQIVAPFIHVL